MPIRVATTSMTGLSGFDPDPGCCSIWRDPDNSSRAFAQWRKAYRHQPPYIPRKIRKPPLHPKNPNSLAPAKFPQPQPLPKNRRLPPLPKNRERPLPPSFPQAVQQPLPEQEQAPERGPE